MKARMLLLLAGLALLAPAGALAHDDGDWRGRDSGRYERRGDKQWRKEMRERAKAQRKADRAWRQYSRKTGRNRDYGYRDYGYRDYGYRGYGDYGRYGRERYLRPFRLR